MIESEAEMPRANLSTAIIVRPSMDIYILRLLTVLMYKSTHLDCGRSSSPNYPQMSNEARNAVFSFCGQNLAAPLNPGKGRVRSSKGEMEGDRVLRTIPRNAPPGALVFGAQSQQEGWSG
jgi:hypothetical protein